MQKQSLKSFLTEYLKAQGGKHIPHWQLMLLVKQRSFRESNAERRLREMSEVGKDFENGVIKGYYWKAPSLQPLEIKEAKYFKSIKEWDAQFRKPEIKTATLW